MPARARGLASWPLVLVSVLSASCSRSPMPTPPGEAAALSRLPSRWPTPPHLTRRPSSEASATTPPARPALPAGGPSEARHGIEPVPDPSPARPTPRRALTAPRSGTEAKARPEPDPTRPPEADPIVALREATRHTERRAVFGLKVNGIERGEITATFRGGDILVPLADLERAGLRPPVGDPLVPLSVLAPAVVARLDESTLTLTLEVSTELLGETRIDLTPRPPPDLARPRDASAFLNYGVSLDTDGYLTGTGELGVRVGDVLATSVVTLATDRPTVRGLTRLDLDDRESLVRWTLGDAFASTGSLGGGVFVGGLTLSRELSLDPYFVQTPGVSFAGATTTPGILDVYVGGQLVRRLEVPAGSFRLEDLPTPAVAGDVRYVLRDAFGGVQTFTRPYAVTADSLKAGLHVYSYSLGVERRSLASASFDYGEPVLLGRHRVGLLDTLTLGWRAELAPMRGLVSGGLDATVALETSRLDLGLHGSHDDKGGVAAFLSWLYPGRVLAASIYGLARTATYRTLGEIGAANTWEVGGRAGLYLPSWQVGLEGHWGHRRDLGDEAAGRVSTAWTFGGSAQLQLVGGVQRLGSTTGFDVGAYLTVTPWACCSGSVGQRVSNTDHETTLGLSIPLQHETAFGLQASAALGGVSRVLIRPEAQTPEGRYQAGLSVIGSEVLASFQAAGAIGWVEGAGFALLRPVTSAFAILEVPEGVEVRAQREGRDIGRTKSGRLVVQDLIPHYGNRIGVVAEELTLDFEIQTTERLIAPAYRGGARVSFDLRPTRYVRGRLIMLVPAGPASTYTLDPGGPALPVVRSDDGREAGVVPTYGRIYVDTRQGPAATEREARPDELVTSPLGRRAEFELRDLAAGRYRALVRFRGATCTTWLTVTSSTPGIEELGLLWCRPEGGPR